MKVTVYEKKKRNRRRVADIAMSMSTVTGMGMTTSTAVNMTTSTAMSMLTYMTIRMHTHMRTATGITMPRRGISVR